MEIICSKMIHHTWEECKLVKRENSTLKDNYHKFEKSMEKFADDDRRITPYKISFDEYIQRYHCKPVDDENVTTGGCESYRILNSIFVYEQIQGQERCALRKCTFCSYKLKCSILNLPQM
jgi:hypothetical protein